MLFRSFCVGVAEGLLSFRLTGPYVRVNGASNVIPAIGSLTNLNPIGRGRGRGSGGPTAPPPPPADQPTSGTASGIGDVVFATTYALYSTTQTGFGLDLTGKVKFGTADEDRKSTRLNSSP